MSGEVIAMEKVLPPQAQETSRSTMDLVQHAIMNGGSMEMVEKLLELHERWEAGQARRAFAQAVAGAKAEIKPIQKNRHVGFTSRDPGKGRTDYDYEDLAEISRSVDPILARHGLSWRHRTKQIEGRIEVTCILEHKDGHFEENMLSAGADTSGNKNSIQAIGSTITFLQRYTLKAALGLAASKDDDGAKSCGGIEKISEAQLDELLDLADQAEANKPAFCNWMGVESLADIPAKEFNKAKQALEAKRGSSMLRARG